MVMGLQTPQSDKANGESRRCCRQISLAPKPWQCDDEASSLNKDPSQTHNQKKGDLIQLILKENPLDFVKYLSNSQTNRFRKGEKPKFILNDTFFT